MTAIHNHLLRATPPTFYTHVSGTGDAVKLAGSLRAAIVTKTPFKATPAAPAAMQAIDLDTAGIDAAIGFKGKNNLAKWGRRLGLKLEQSMLRRGMIVVFAVMIIAAEAAVTLYNFALPGLSSARQIPPNIEVTHATWLLTHSVPAAQADRINPLTANEAGGMGRLSLEPGGPEVGFSRDGVLPSLPSAVGRRGIKNIEHRAGRVGPARA